MSFGLSLPETEYYCMECSTVYMEDNSTECPVCESYKIFVRETSHRCKDCLMETTVHKPTKCPFCGSKRLQKERDISGYNSIKEKRCHSKGDGF